MSTGSVSRTAVLRRVRDEVRAIAPYKVPHGPPGAIVLDANESPWPLPESARERIAEVLRTLAYHRYPDIDATTFRAALAQRVAAAPDELIIGVGSDEVIAVLCTTFARPGSAVLVPDPTFSMYSASAALAGMRTVRVPLDERFRLDVPKMIAAIERESPALIFLATPNNPTGNAHTDVELEAIVRAAPDALVVIDEAYAPFSGRTLGGWVDRFPNIGVMGTLSKVGLAALRLGWIRVRAELALELDKVRAPYDLPTPSQVIGTLMLTELASVIEGHVAAICAERERLTAALAPFVRVRTLTIHK